MSKLREHLERRDLGWRTMVVFDDEINKYATADGPDTYVRKKLLDLSERGRYLGLVLFSAYQFRSQGLAPGGRKRGDHGAWRMDGDKLVLPGIRP